MSDSKFDVSKIDIINAALADCQSSLQASYEYIDKSNVSLNQSEDSKNELLAQINLSLTILELMKRGSK